MRNARLYSKPIFETLFGEPIFTPFLSTRLILDQPISNCHNCIRLRIKVSLYELIENLWQSCCVFSLFRTIILICAVVKMEEKTLLLTRDVIYILFVAGIIASKICIYYLHLLTTIEKNLMVTKPILYKKFGILRGRYGYYGHVQWRPTT